MKNKYVTVLALLMSLSLIPAAAQHSPIKKIEEGIDYILLNQTAKDHPVITHYLDPGTFLE
jgi:hypothetical protein